MGLLAGLVLSVHPVIAAERVLVLGDSISAAYNMPVKSGWVALLEERLQQEMGPKSQVFNASISGETSAGGVARIAELLQRHDPTVVILELGGNDGLRGLPIDQIATNLTDIARRARSAGAKVVLLGMRIPPNYGPRYTEDFYSIYRELAADTGTALVPFLLEGIATDPSLMQTDRIHPNLAAQPMLLALVWPKLKSLLTQD